LEEAATSHLFHHVEQTLHGQEEHILAALLEGWSDLWCPLEEEPWVSEFARQEEQVRLPGLRNFDLLRALLVEPLKPQGLVVVIGRLE
jgi:hypothetical protein